MRGRTAVALTVLLAGCSQIGGDGVTYQQLLAKLCAAPPSVMGNVLTTPQLQQGWEFICAHIASVSAQRVP